MKDFFASNLRYLRSKYKYSQEQLALKINQLADDKDEEIHYTTIGRYENGNREPTIGNVVKIAKVFNIPIADMVARDLKNNANKNDENAEIELLRKVLIEKGLMKNEDDLTQEEFDKLIQFVEANKKFILSQDE